MCNLLMGCMIPAAARGRCGRRHRRPGQFGIDWLGMPRSSESVRVAAVGDLHFGRGSPSLRSLVDYVAEEADVLALCGDLTDTGLPDEATLLAKEFAMLKLPIVSVLGNHDYESGQV